MTKRRGKRKHGSYIGFLFSAILVNIIILVAIALTQPSINLGEAHINVESGADSWILETQGEGWVKLPPYYQNTSNVTVTLLVGNLTLGPFPLDIVEYSGEKTGIVSFNASREIPGNPWKELLILPDVKFKLDLKPYEPMPATISEYIGSGCFKLDYILAVQMNVTVYLCFYQVNPHITVTNNETLDLRVVYTVETPTGREEYKMNVKPGETRTLNVSSVRVAQGNISMYLSGYVYWIDVVNGVKILDLTRNIHLVLIPVNIFIAIYYLTLRRKRSRPR